MVSTRETKGSVSVSQARSKSSTITSITTSTHRVQSLLGDNECKFSPQVSNLYEYIKKIQLYVNR